jgi:purine-binding chemotaxis protein CheW
MSAEALICRVGRLRLALPLAHVVEALRPLPVQALARAPAFVRGLSVIRDEPVPVVDTATLLGTRHDAAPRRIVVLRAGSRRVALTMDEVLGVRPFDASHQPELPALLSDSVSELVSTIATLDGGLLLALQAAFRLPDSVWEDIEGRTVERVAG